MSCDLLVLDDLATEQLSKSSEAVLFEIIDHRTEQHLHTLITCNLQPKQLANQFSNLNSQKIMRRLGQFFLLIDFDSK